MDWEKFENHLLNEGVTKTRIVKLHQMFGTCQRGLEIDYEKATRNNIEAFLNKLNRNEFRRIDGKDYSGSSKADIKKFLKQFYKWLKGDNEFYPKEVSWIKARISKDEQPKEKTTLSVDEVQKLANGFAKTEYRLIILMLFDSGFRIQEMLSAKKNDLTWEDYMSGKKCFWITCNKSKTETRKIPIPLFTEEIQTFVNSTYYRSLSNDNALFKLSQPNLTRLMKEKSIELFDKDRPVTPHALRHSSATYYSQEFDGNMNLIATRYGWSFSSKELKTYIRRSGAYQKAGVKKVYQNEVVKLKEEVDKLKKKMEHMSKTQEIIQILIKDSQAVSKLQEALKIIKDK